MSNEMFDAVLNQTDIAIVIYLPKFREAEYVSESVKLLFGLEQETVKKDINSLFEKLIFVDDADDIIDDFCNGNLQLTVQRKAAYRYADDQYAYHFEVKMIPYEKDRFILILTDVSDKVEMKQTMITALSAYDYQQKTNSDFLCAVDQDVRKFVDEISHLVVDEKINLSRRGQNCLDRIGLSYKRFREMIEEVKKGTEGNNRNTADNENDSEALSEGIEKKLHKVIKASQYSGRNVLIVENNEVNCDIACDIIKYMGAHVDTASNGKDAVDMFVTSAEGFYDIIFMNVRMPVMNGYEATKKIRALERKDAKLIPVIAMTSHVFSEDIREPLRAGMDMYVAKPLNLQKISLIMNKFC